MVTFLSLTRQFFLHTTPIDIINSWGICKRSLLQPIDFQRAFGRFCLTIVDFKGLQAAVARQEGCQVLAFMGGFQFAEKIADVLARVDFIVFAALDHRVHEGVVRRRALASDIAGIAEVHLEFPYALLADIVRHLDISAFKYTFHRWPFGPCISHGFFQQLTTSGIIRQSIVGKSILYLTHQVGSAAWLEPGDISFSACHVLLLEAVFLCEDHPCSVYEPHRLIVVLFQCVLIYIKQTDFINIYNRSKAITNPIRAYRILREA